MFRCRLLTAGYDYLDVVISFARIFPRDSEITTTDIIIRTTRPIMSVLEAGEDRTTMSPLDEVVSPTSVESELMVTDILDEHEATLNEHRDDGKHKRDTDGEELTPRKLPSLTRNNNDVGFVLEENPDDELHEDRDDVSLESLFFFFLFLSFFSDASYRARTGK